MNDHTVVVGASSGVGLATARKFASRGDRLTLISRSEAGLLKAAASIDGNPRVLALDMRDGASVSKAFLQDTIDHVVLTAVTGEMGRLAPLRELTAEDRSALRAWAEESLPARHLGEPEDAADYIFSLANNRYATGDVAVLDGGLALI